MLSINTKVEQIVSASAFLTEGMRLGLINLSELARQLRPRLESDLWKPVGHAAVVMALRRLTERALSAGQTEDVGPAPQLGEELVVTLPPHMGELTMRTDLALQAYRLSDNSNECRRALLTLAEQQPEKYLSVTHGEHEMLVICSRQLLATVDAAFHAECQLARDDRVTALTLRLTPETVTAPGIYHAVLKQLALNKISLATIVCTPTEMTMLLEPGQVAPAYAILSDIVLH